MSPKPPEVAVFGIKFGVRLYNFIKRYVQKNSYGNERLFEEKEDLFLCSPYLDYMAGVEGGTPRNTIAMYRTISNNSHWDSTTRNNVTSFWRYKYL